MSNSMFWRPAPRNIPPGEWLDDALKHKLGMRLWESYASRNGPVELDASTLPYLEGLADGGVAGAADLIEAIRKHEKVYVWIGDSDDY